MPSASAARSSAGSFQSARTSSVIGRVRQRRAQRAQVGVGASTDSGTSTSCGRLRGARGARDGGVDAGQHATAPAEARRARRCIQAARCVVA